MTFSLATASDGEWLLPQAFGDLYEEHFDFVWRNLRRLGVADGDLEDATQETFMTAFRRGHTFLQGGSPRAWIYGICRRIAFRYRRRTGRRHRLLRALAEAPFDRGSPESPIDTQDARRALHRFLDRLSAVRRDVFILAELEGMTGPEIARMLEVNPNTVGSRLREARASFARYVHVLSVRSKSARQRWEPTNVIARCREDDPAKASRRGAVRAALASRWLAPAFAPSLSLGMKATFAVLVGGALSFGAAIRGSSPADPASEGPKPSPTPLGLGMGPPHSAPPTRMPPIDTATIVPVPASRTAHADARRKPRPPSTPTPPDPLLAELEALRPAQHAVAQRQFSAALELLDHRPSLAHSSLHTEALAIRVAALCGLGRETEARRVAETLRSTAHAHASANVAAQGCEKKPTQRHTPGEPRER